MADRSVGASQVITSPQGGGALHGIGEKFAPNLFTGTGNFTVPIALPPGRNGFQPELNLVYSTGKGNGPFGLGWSLSIPGVSRKTSKGVPRYDDSKDIFILSGVEDLVPVDELENKIRYRPRTEGLFARIDHHHETNPNHWEVCSKEGLVSFYGTEKKSEEADPNWQDPAVIADPNPAKRHKIFAWKLSETRDPFGNRIVYEYDRDSGKEGPHHWDQVYLKRIQYADYTTEDGETKFLVSVAFCYEDEEECEEKPKYRPDPFSDYRAGFEIRTRRRCKQIEIRTHADEERLVRTYNLFYLDQREDLDNLEHLLPLNGFSLLNQIKVIGYAGDDTEELPPLEFGYTVFEPERRNFDPLAGRELPPRSLANPDFEIADLFGNGLPDILQMNGVVRYWRNRGNGIFDPPRPMREAPAGLSLADDGVQLLDANGDGRLDLLVTVNGLSGYFPSRFGGSWDHRSFQSHDVGPSFNLEDPEVRLVDLDGDGLTDIIRSSSHLECYFNDPEEGWKESCFVERQGLEVFPDINFSDERVRWADMNGDKLQDIVLVHDGNIEYWPNMGHGNWGPRIHMNNSPRFPYVYAPSRVLFGDVDGDGLADIVYVDHYRVFLWINQGGNRWSDPIEIDGTPPQNDLDLVRLADVYGTGIQGVLWSRDYQNTSRENLFFLDFAGGIKPFLLNSMNNNMGAVTQVEYVPSTRFFLEDETRRETRWQTPLPFPVQVVASVEVIDKISKYKMTTEYSYHHGYWDGHEREFRGFGRVDQRDTEVFEHFHEEGLHPGSEFISIEPDTHSPPTETRTWFHLGPVGDLYGDWEQIDLSHEYWPIDAGILGSPEESANKLASMSSNSHLNRSIKRDAIRTLRGRVLRTELYGLDSSERQDRPYAVTENLYGFREESEPGLDEVERKRIFFPYSIAQRATQWDRGEDPVTQITYIGNYDAWGQPLEQTVVAMPRRQAMRKPVVGVNFNAIVDETQILTTHTRTHYASPINAATYIHDRVAQTRSFELTNPPAFNESDPNDLQRVLADQAVAARAIHQQFMAVFNGWQIGDSVPPSGVNLFQHAINHYDGLAFVGREVGEVGDYGALTRSEALIFTDRVLDVAYGIRLPTYLGGPMSLPPEAPVINAASLGYTLIYKDEPDGHHPGYYIDTLRQQYDFQDSTTTLQRGLVTATQDALTNQTDFRMDAYWFLPVQVTDAVGLVTQAAYDYRTLQPETVIDPNGHSTLYRYTPLGLLHKLILQSRDGEGGTEQRPEILFTYNFLYYLDNELPIYVHTAQRIHHANQGISDDLIEAREYSDGYGRLIQMRTQAEELVLGETGDDIGLPPEPDSTLEPAVGQRVTDRVVVSGWQVYDNKGQVVEQYEPFFSRGWEYQPEAEAKRGQHATLYYDPCGQVIRTMTPDGSQQQFIFGIPIDMGDPTDFSPTPWESFAYDPNDLAPLSQHPDKTSGSLVDHALATHHFTPTSIVLDALGRTICQIERNGPVQDQDWHLTRSRYDMRGNLLTVMDALGRTSFQHAYDLLDHSLRVDSIDAGLRMSVLDAVGNLVEYRDSKGSVTLHQYDNLNRLTHLWARNDADTPVTLRERLIYGDDEDRLATRQSNLLGRLFKYFDEAGLQRFDHYDFKGNLEEKTRQVVSDAAIAKGWIADWSAAGAESALDDISYQTSIQYDSLNRPLEIIYPQDVNGQRPVLEPHYNRAGALERVGLDGVLYVGLIAYNAKGQRLLIAHGNGVMTRYTYDPQSFRLARLRSERYQGSSPTDTWISTGAPLQDFTYGYDLVGNITAIEDRTPNSGVNNSLHGRDRLVRQFDYDPLYRLTRADGRACKDIGVPRPLTDLGRCGSYEAPFAGGPASPNQNNAPNLTEAYTETYEYNPMSNMTKLRYTAGSGNWTRTFDVENGSNRLTGMTQTGLTHRFEYDANGNMIQQNTERRYAWDHADRMIAFTIQPQGVTQPSVEAHYLYGADGIRVKKWVPTKGSGDGESTVYINGMFEHYTNKATGLTNNHVHIMDDQQRIALVRRGLAHPKDAGPPIQYHLGDHLGSNNVVIDGDGDWINREEYFPYGETSFGSFARKLYRFTGKERDEESGLYYHGARYYAPWLARWISSDPAGMGDGVNLYAYVGNNPIRFMDSLGLQSNDEVEQNQWGEGEIVYSQEGIVGFWEGGAIHSGHEVVVINEKVTEITTFKTNFMTIGNSYFVKFAWDDDYQSVSEKVYKQHLWHNRNMEDIYASPELRKKHERTLGNLSTLKTIMEGSQEIVLETNILGRLALGTINVLEAKTLEGKVGAVVNAFGVPGLRGKSKIGRVTSGVKQVKEPDVYAISLIRWKKKAKGGNIRGVTDVDRRKARKIAENLGHTGPVDVGHSPATPHVFTKPGQDIWLRAEPRGPNRRGGWPLRREAQRIRGNPSLGIYVRPKRKR